MSGPTSKPTTACWRSTLTDRPPARTGHRILGLDPGSRTTGWGVVERHGSALKVLDYGRVKLAAGRPLSSRLVTLADGVGELIDRHRPEVAVLETLFRGVNVRSLVVLAQARGVLLETVARAGLEIHEYAPAEIKSAVTGNGRADKEQVGKMVRMILGLRQARIDADAADALAVAICYAQRAKLDSLDSGALSGVSANRRKRLVRRR